MAIRQCKEIVGFVNGDKACSTPTKSLTHFQQKGGDNRFGGRGRRGN
jgi:hypothetical protein